MHTDRDDSGDSDHRDEIHTDRMCSFDRCCRPGRTSEPRDVSNTRPHTLLGRDDAYAQRRIHTSSICWRRAVVCSYYCTYAARSGEVTPPCRRMQVNIQAFQVVVAIGHACADMPYLLRRLCFGSTCYIYQSTAIKTGPDVKVSQSSWHITRMCAARSMSRDLYDPRHLGQ
jgi:hypothetical protein